MEMRLARYGPLLREGTLACQPTNLLGKYFLFHHKLYQDFALTHLAGADCLFRLVIDQPDVSTDTFLDCGPEEQALFSGLSLQVKQAEGDGEWVPYQLVKGIQGRQTLAFARRIFATLPPQEREVRTRRAAFESYVETRRRRLYLQDYEAMSKAAKEAFDGKASLWSGQSLLLGKQMIRRLQKCRVKAEDRMAAMSALG